MFDPELYVEKGDQRYGPYLTVDGPIPLHRYRKFKKSKTQERADRIYALAKQLVLPRAALEGNRELKFLSKSQPMLEPAVIPFQDPDPFGGVYLSQHLGSQAGYARLPRSAFG